MESTALSKVREYSPEELATIEKCGSVGFSYKELALILAVPELETIPGLDERPDANRTILASRNTQRCFGRVSTND